MQRFILIILFISIIFSFQAQEITYIQSPQNAFIENKGQWDKKVFFKAKTENGNLWIQDRKFLFHFQDFTNLHNNHNFNHDYKNGRSKMQTVVHLNFLNSNPFKLSKKENPTQHYYNFFIGKDSSKWASDVHGFSDALFENIYDGINLKLIENKGKIKYEFHVQPHKSINQIQLQLVGQDKIFIGKNGDLHIQTSLGEIIEEAPYTYQIINGKIIEIKSKFELLERNIVRFKIENYNPNEVLIIDPVLVFATYSGSVTDNFGMTATFAHNGEAYSGGTVFGNQYPTPDKNAYDISSNFTVNAGSYGITDVFISKYSADGSQMIWTNYIGGGDNDQGTETVHSLIADKNDNLYLFGATSSLDFPIVNGFQSQHNGGIDNYNFFYNGIYFLQNGTDLYVSKISSNGQSLLGSTYVGGSSNDGVNTVDRTATYLDAVATYPDGTQQHYNKNAIIYDSLTPNYGDNFRGEIMLDYNENVIVASCTRSVDFPLSNAFQNSIGGKQDGVVFKLNNNLSNLIWSSYIGGSKNDACYSVKVDYDQNVFVTGGTSSSNLNNTSGTFQSTFQGGKADGFVSKISNNGTKLEHISYVGTSNFDQSYFVEIDQNNDIYLFGQSLNGQFPVVNTIYTNPNSCQFICKLDSSLTTLKQSTTIGNGDSTKLNISPSAFLVDNCGTGRVYISGWGSSLFDNTGLSGMPVTSDALFQTAPNGHDFYMMVLDQNMDSLIYGSYIGGNQSEEHVDGGTSRFDKNGIVYQSVCAGCGKHSDFPTTTNAWSKLNLSDNCNNALFKFDFEKAPKSSITYDSKIGCTNTDFIFNNSSINYTSFLWDFGNGDTNSISSNITKKYNAPGSYVVKLTIDDIICNNKDSITIIINVSDSIRFDTLTKSIFNCLPKNYNLIGNSFGTATQFQWSSNINFTDTLNQNINDSTLTYFADEGTHSLYLKYSNDGCFLIDSVFIYIEQRDYKISGNNKICPAGDTTLLSLNNNSPIEYSYIWTDKQDIIGPDTLNFVKYSPQNDKYAVVQLTSQNGCVIKDSVLIQVGNLDTNLVLLTASDTLIPYNSSIELTASPLGFSYQWEPSNLVVDNQAISTESLKLKNDTEFILKVKDGPCEKSDTILVKVFEFICGDPSIFIPNAFSPNADGNNDLIYVRGKMIDELLFRVYDRWGNLIFETTERSIGWDGTYKGKKCPPDVYDYYLKVICVDQIETEIKGNITLLK